MEQKITNLVTDHIDIWTTAIEQKSSAGRGSSKKFSLYGIKKLRELILDLAVRGKLVAQDPNDESAAVLLERIAAEKAHLVKEGKLKKQKSLPEIGEEEKPFELPNGWEWSRLGELGYTQTGGTPSKNKSEYFGNDIPFIKPGDILDGKINYSNEALSLLGAKSLGRIATASSLLMVCIGTIGKCTYIDRDCAFNQQINSITPYVNITEYLFKALSAIYFQNTAWELSASTTIAIINKGKWESIPVVLPPIEEQHRIVAKVDELMALCDALEAQTEASITAHQTLVTVLLDALLIPKTGSPELAESFAQNWQRLHDHFDTLFTTVASIDALKQTILQLAVMGKLVKQDPNDEPAEKLLERIAKEKAQLIKEGKIKKQKPLPEITDDEKPFELPRGWEFERLGNLTSRLGSGSTPRGGQSAYVAEGVIFLRSQNVWNDGLKLDDTAYISEETHLKMANTCVYPQDVLLNITGASLGRSMIFPKELKTANVSQHVTVIRLIKTDMCDFLHLGIKSPLVQQLVWGRQVGMAIEGLSKKVLEQFEFPVPPLEEQHRIVAKVEQLMSLCDQLKTRLTAAQQTQLHLTDALVEHAVRR